MQSYLCDSPAACFYPFIYPIFVTITQHKHHLHSFTIMNKFWHKLVPNYDFAQTRHTLKILMVQSNYTVIFIKKYRQYKLLVKIYFIHCNIMFKLYLKTTLYTFLIVTFSDSNLKWFYEFVYTCFFISFQIYKTCNFVKCDDSNN